MKITKRILSIPPFLTTPWENVSSVQMDSENLLIALDDGQRVAIPNLDSEAIAKVFAQYEAYLEEETLSDEEFFQKIAEDDGLLPPKGMMPPGVGHLRFDLSSANALAGSFMQHDSGQMNAPPMPPEVLEKIVAITKALAPEDIEAIPKPEPHCNCPHCQISRSIRGELPDSDANSEETVLDEELTFREWDIEECGKNLFRVTSPLDKEEQYTVYLGEELGCTCGEADCEHIRHVLLS